jgi:hypothetical protein
MTHVIGKVIETDAFWSHYRINPGCWPELTRTLVRNLFGNDFLKSVEETDQYFSLKIEHLNITRYANMLIDALPRDDLDKCCIA